MKKRRNPKFWFKNEKELMKELGLNPTPGSGNGIIKEDGQNDYLIAQLKSTESEQITLKLKDINTLFYNSIVSHKTPVFINQFMNGPLLLTIRIEDLENVYNYLTKKVIKDKNEDIIEITNTKDDKPKIKGSSKKELIKEKMRLESEKYYKRR